MNKFSFKISLLCLFAVAILARVAMTQDATENRFEDAPLTEAGSDTPSYYDPNSTQRARENVRDNFDTSLNRRTNRTQDTPLASDEAEERALKDLLENRFGRRRQPTPSMMRPRQVTRTVVETVYEPVPPEEVAEAKKLQDAIKLMNVSTNDAEKKKAAETIQEQLRKQFERDLKTREKELEKVEKRVLKLREQLDKRKAAQDDIINLRLQTLVNEASGLGFPTNSFGTPRNGVMGNPFGQFAPTYGPETVPRGLYEDTGYSNYGPWNPEEYDARDQARDMGNQLPADRPEFPDR